MRLGEPIPRRVPLLGANPNYSKVIYGDPPSHDSLNWIIAAELNRRVMQPYSDALHVRLMLDDGYLGRIDYGPHGFLAGLGWPFCCERKYSDIMIPNVLVPAIDMIGAVRDPDLHVPVQLEDVADYCEYDYHVRVLVDASRAGHPVPKWTVPKWALDEAATFLDPAQFGPPIVITLREADNQPQRNSNIPEWLKFAEWASEGWPVVFIRDTATCHLEFPWRTYPRASENAYIRAATYQLALCNLFTSGGAVAWAVYSDAPYMIFKLLLDNLPDWEMSKPTGWKDEAHIEPGQDFPWARPNQRLIWKQDNFEDIKHEFCEFLMGDGSLSDLRDKGRDAWNSTQASSPNFASK